jgi:hypothetical protein
LRPQYSYLLWQAPCSVQQEVSGKMIHTKYIRNISQMGRAEVVDFLLPDQHYPP